MTRVIAGLARGRRLAVPGGGTRPTSDRAREGLFSTVTSLHGPLDGARVADLYAGSGAVGLEALSRGAVHVLMVESDPAAGVVLRANAAVVGLPGAQVRVATVSRLVAAANPGEPYDLVFLDPPYALPATEVAEVLAALPANGWTASGGLVAVERSSRDAELAWPAGFVAERTRRYGEATIWYATTEV